VGGCVIFAISSSPLRLRGIRARKAIDEQLRGDTNLATDPNAWKLACGAEAICGRPANPKLSDVITDIADVKPEELPPESRLGKESGQRQTSPPRAADVGRAARPRRPAPAP
jgi:hypothetical protein